MPCHAMPCRRYRTSRAKAEIKKAFQPLASINRPEVGRRTNIKIAPPGGRQAGSQLVVHPCPFLNVARRPSVPLLLFCRTCATYPRERYHASLALLDTTRPLNAAVSSAQGGPVAVRQVAPLHPPPAPAQGEREKHDTSMQHSKVGVLFFCGERLLFCCLLLYQPLLVSCVLVQPLVGNFLVSLASACSPAFFLARLPRVLPPPFPPAYQSSCWPHQILVQRLKVPPSINQFSQAIDKNQATELLKVLMKYQPEDKKAKQQRLKEIAAAKEAGNDPAPSKAPKVCGLRR